MSPWDEDRLLARTARFGEWWTLERLHEAFDGLTPPEQGREVPGGTGEGARPEPDGPSAPG